MLSIPREPQTGPAQTRRQLRLSVLALRVWRGPRLVLGPVDFEVAGGECVVVAGRNGSGKSTLLGAIHGALHSSLDDAVVHGSVEIDGVPLTDAMVRPHANGVSRGLTPIAYVPQRNNCFLSLTVAENLASALLGRKVHDSRERIARVLGSFPDLARVAHERADSVSGGQRQQLAVALGLIRSPRILLLDEPMLGLSTESAEAIVRALRDIKIQGTAVLVAEHRLSTFTPVADRLIGLRNGAVVVDVPWADGPTQATLSQVFGEDLPI